MKLLKKISSLFISLCIMLSVVCFSSAAPLSEQRVKECLNEIEFKKIFNQKEKLRFYPEVISVVSAILLDLKVEEDDFSGNMMKSLGYNLRNMKIENGKVFLSNDAVFIQCIFAILKSEFLSKYEMVREPMVTDHFTYTSFVVEVRDNTGVVKKYFYWLNKKREKKTSSKKLICGKDIINENDIEEDCNNNIIGENYNGWNVLV